MLLLDTLQFEQTLAMGNDIIAKAKDGAGASHYTDFNDQYIWILDQRARRSNGLAGGTKPFGSWSRPRAGQKKA